MTLLPGATREGVAAAAAVPDVQPVRAVGPGTHRRPRHLTHCEPPSLEFNDILSRGEQYLPGPSARQETRGELVIAVGAGRYCSPGSTQYI